MKKLGLSVFVLLFVVGLTSCRRPYEQPVYIEVAPNETAFLVPLEVQSLDGQAQVRSIAFLEEAKVQSKRIKITHRWDQTGRLDWEGKYIPTMDVIKVDRTPVSRVWTAEKGSGTSEKAEAIWVETSDSIEFSMATSMTAQVLEDQTALFLYRFAGRSLSDVMDAELRTAVMNLMNAEFGALSLTTATEQKVTVVKKVRKAVTEMASKWGIDISTFGSAGGMVFKDAEIQKQINEAFKAEKAIYIAQQEALAQDERNLMNIAKAKAQATEAKEWAKSAQIYERKIRLENESKKADAMLKWNGQYPDKMLILPEGNSTFMTLGDN